MIVVDGESIVLKRLEDLLRFNLARDMRFHDQVDKPRQRDSNVRLHVVPVLNQAIGVFVRGRVAGFANRIPDGLLALVEVQAFDALEKVRPGSAKVGAKSLKRDTQQDACCPRRIVENILSFVVRLLDRFWHVFGCRDADKLWPDNASVDLEHESVAAFVRTVPDANVVWIDEKTMPGARGDKTVGGDGVSIDCDFLAVGTH